MRKTEVPARVLRHLQQVDTYTDLLGMTDEERTAWNDAVATGDPDTIDAARRVQLRIMFTRVMDDDPNYQRAGWTPGRAGLRKGQHNHQLVPGWTPVAGCPACDVIAAGQVRRASS